MLELHSPNTLFCYFLVLLIPLVGDLEQDNLIHPQGWESLFNLLHFLPNRGQSWDDEV